MDTTAILARLPGSRATARISMTPSYDFRHFLREQLGHEAAVGARQHDLGALGLATDVVDVGADAVADVEVLARDRLVAAHDAFATAQIDDDIAVFDALDAAVDDLAGAILVLVVLALALGFANLVHDDLAGHLGLDAADLERRQVFFIDLAHLGVAPGALGDRQLDLADFALDLFVVADHGDDPLLAGLARARVDLHPDVVLGAVTGAGRLLKSVLDRLDDDFLLDAFFARDRVGDLQQLEPVGGNADGHGQSSSLSDRSKSSSSASSPRSSSSASPPSAATRAARCVGATASSHASVSTSLASTSHSNGK